MSLGGFLAKSLVRFMNWLELRACRRDLLCLLVKILDVLRRMNRRSATVLKPEAKANSLEDADIAYNLCILE
jgi:hypothetical protein